MLGLGPGQEPGGRGQSLVDGRRGGLREGPGARSGTSLVGGARRPPHVARAPVPLEHRALLRHRQLEMRQQALGGGEALGRATERRGDPGRRPARRVVGRAQHPRHAQQGGPVPGAAQTGADQLLKEHAPARLAVGLGGEHAFQPEMGEDGGADVEAGGDPVEAVVGPLAPSLGGGRRPPPSHRIEIGPELARGQALDVDPDARSAPPEHHAQVADEGALGAGADAALQVLPQAWGPRRR